MYFSASFEGRIAVLNEYLHHVVNEPVRRAELLLQKAELLWRKRQQTEHK